MKSYKLKSKWAQIGPFSSIIDHVHCLNRLVGTAGPIIIYQSIRSKSFFVGWDCKPPIGLGLIHMFVDHQQSVKTLIYGTILAQWNTPAKWTVPTCHELGLVGIMQITMPANCQCHPPIPSGKRLHSYGKSPFWMGKIHYLWPFSIATLIITRGYHTLLPHAWLAWSQAMIISCWSDPFFFWWNPPMLAAKVPMSALNSPALVVKKPTFFDLPPVLWT